MCVENEVDEKEEEEEEEENVWHRAGPAPFVSRWPIGKRVSTGFWGPPTTRKTTLMVITRYDVSPEGFSPKNNNRYGFSPSLQPISDG